MDEKMDNAKKVDVKPIAPPEQVKKEIPKLVEPVIRRKRKTNKEMFKMKKMFFNDKTKFFMLIVLSVLLINVGVVFFTGMFQKKVNILFVDSEKIFLDRSTKFLSRNDINDNNINMIYNGDYDKIFAFYNSIIENDKVTTFIIKYANERKVPLNLLVALCYVESKFAPNVVSPPNKDGSYDYGLFQLNSNTFKKYPKDYLMLIENNVGLATEYLSTVFEKYKGWEESVVAYNFGTSDGIPNSTLKHFIDVVKYEKELDIIYNKCFTYGYGLGMIINKDLLK